MPPLKDEKSALTLLYDLSRQIIEGANFEQCLDFIYDSFQTLVPYDRIGYADKEGDIARARWPPANERMLLRTGYSAPLAGSSLSFVVERRVPRVLDDLPAYLENRPNSRATQLMVSEGIKSSMTCPLHIGDKPVGLLFFSSRTVNTYDESHVQIMKETAMHLAMLLMAAEHVMFEKSEEQTKDEEPDRKQYLPISQLKSGMILRAPLYRPNKTLLLAAALG
jgi:transcriptional regulator with GAF, ATPase, and Fis domain